MSAATLSPAAPAVPAVDLSVHCQRVLGSWRIRIFAQPDAQVVVATELPATGPLAYEPGFLEVAAWACRHLEIDPEHTTWIAQFPAREGTPPLQDLVFAERLIRHDLIIHRVGGRDVEVRQAPGSRAIPRAELEAMIGGAL